jgi:Spy/CpxP family protein refolding chaperone
VIRSVALRSCFVVTALALALQAAPAGAQAPARQGAPPPAPHLWWNDAEVTAKLSLTIEQRSRMDELYKKFQRDTATRATAVAARDEFHAALREGDMERARTKLAAWADAENAQLRGQGTLRIEALSLLDAEQWKALRALKPDFLAAPWAPRSTWTYAPPPKRPAPAKAPAKAP